MIVVEPAATPVTFPVPSTVPTPVLLLLQKPLPDASVNAEESPMQTFVVPVIAGGKGFTVTVVYVAQPVPSV